MQNLRSLNARVDYRRGVDRVLILNSCNNNHIGLSSAKLSSIMSSKVYDEIQRFQSWKPQHESMIKRTQASAADTRAKGKGIHVEVPRSLSPTKSRQSAPGSPRWPVKSLEDGESKLTLKTPRGTRDYGPQQMTIREQVLGVVTSVFKKHGAQALDTPVFELRDILLGKYGEEGGKLVYDLEEHGGERLSMRYDLTVPFARHLAMNRITNMKRYHIAKVYRRDNPKMTRGRYREFLQCVGHSDFDIAGQYDPMLPDVECLKIVDEILGALNLGEYVIKVNHRGLLDGMLAVCGIKKSKFKSVCSSIDKLDKLPWQNVRDEIVTEKGVSQESADKLEPILRLRELHPSMSCDECIDHLRGINVGKDKDARKALDDLNLLMGYCRKLDINDRVRFEPSLARGLDYYTGTIYEAVITDFAKSSEIPSDKPADTEEEEVGGVGSVAGGGRYDGLVGMFMSKSQQVPCVGVSIGIERLFAIMTMKHEQEKIVIRTCETQIYVASAHKKLTDARLTLTMELWKAGFKTEMPYKKDPRLLDQLQYCEDKSIPLCLILGGDELERGVVKLRNVVTREEKDVNRSELIDELRNALQILDKKNL